MPLLFLCELVGILTEPYVFGRFLGAHPCKERLDAGWNIALWHYSDQSIYTDLQRACKMRNRVQLRIGFPTLQVRNAAIRRPELFGQFNLCQAKLMPCPVQGNSKKIANIVHTFTLSYCFHSNLNFASNERCLASRH